MSLSFEKKQEIIKKFRTNERDTASPQVQVALLTARLNYLKDHFQAHTKDHLSRRGLFKMVGKRRKLLDFLYQHDESSYKKLITDLGIRK